MKAKIPIILAALAALMLVCAAAQGQVSVEYLGAGAATAISADGSVVVGNSNFDYETWRWTSETGIQLLGRATVPVLGTGAGGPDVSDDGQFVSASILGRDETYMTPGRWSVDLGWEETMPPPPPDGGLLDSAYGSAWGISGDGSTVVGLYWRPGQPDGLAHALSWSPESGPVGHGSTGGNSRANDCSADGSVLVGWDEAPFGYWMPTIWEDDVLTHLTETENWCMADAVTPDGNIIVGSSAAPGEGALREAAVWYRNGDTWDELILGTLPGTINPYGNARARDVSDDGSIIVGFNAWNPGYSVGFIWTAEIGMVDVADYLAVHGVTFDPSLFIVTLNGISGDGRHICGVAVQWDPPYLYESFIIHLEDPTAVSETPLALQLGSNYPNPFNPQTTIPVIMNQDGRAHLDVYDTAGRLVRTLHSGMLSVGRHEFRWDGKDSQGLTVSSGIYVARISDATGRSMSRQMLLLK